VSSRKEKEEVEGMSTMMDKWLKKTTPGDKGMTRPPGSVRVSSHKNEESIHKSLESRRTTQTRPVTRNHITTNCPLTRRRDEIEVCDWFRRVRNAAVPSRSVQVGENWIQRSSRYRQEDRRQYTGDITHNMDGDVVGVPSIKFSVCPNHWANSQPK
jgi:hypothetical protein